jgi:hypothetical protein
MTNQLQNGQQKLNKIDELLEKYDKKNIVPNFEQEGNEINEYLNISRQTLSKIHANDLAEINYRLAQYSLYLQRLWNEHIAIKSWAESTLKIVILPELEKLDIWAYEHKRSQAIQNNDYAKKLNKLIMLASIESDKLYLLSDRVKHISFSISKLIEVKLKQ